MQSYEDVKMLQDAEELADGVWQLVSQWDKFAKDTVAAQFVRAADSVGANIAESYGRFHYGEKIQFLYYARGSVFETKYWLNRALERKLISTEAHRIHATRLTNIAKQINGFAQHLKMRRYRGKSNSVLKEDGPVYRTFTDSAEDTIFAERHLTWIALHHDGDFSS